MLPAVPTGLVGSVSGNFVLTWFGGFLHKCWDRQVLDRDIQLPLEGGRTQWRSRHFVVHGTARKAAGQDLTRQGSGRVFDRSVTSSLPSRQQWRQRCVRR